MKDGQLLPIEIDLKVRFDPNSRAVEVIQKLGKRMSMYLTKNFALKEMTKSSTAERLGLTNIHDYGTHYQFGESL